MSVGTMPDETVLVVVPEPGSTPQQRACDVLDAHTLQKFARDVATLGRWRCVVADFELA